MTTENPTTNASEQNAALAIDAGNRPTVGRKNLPKGWTEGSVQDLLGLTDEEAAIVEMRVRLAERARKRRRSQRITQEDLARRMRSTQPRIAGVEQADASIEMLMRAFFVLGDDRKEIANLLVA